MMRIGSVTNECRHIFDPDVMLFGRIVVFEKQEVHVAFSFAFGAAIFHREPFDGYGEVEFFKKGYLLCFNGKIQPSTFRECS